ncbi:unnamed protein product [Amoebophrya sp. A25]|nr:unnamed protein product [Amoebophrya sp. A25]|eukprot:GSA25T00005096001.1
MRAQREKVKAAGSSFFFSLKESLASAAVRAELPGKPVELPTSFRKDKISGKMERAVETLRSLSKTSSSSSSSSSKPVAESSMAGGSSEGQGQETATSNRLENALPRRDFVASQQNDDGAGLQTTDMFAGLQGAASSFLEAAYEKTKAETAAFSASGVGSRILGSAVPLGSATMTGSAAASSTTTARSPTDSAYSSSSLSKEGASDGNVAVPSEQTATQPPPAGDGAKFSENPQPPPPPPPTKKDGMLKTLQNSLLPSSSSKKMQAKPVVEEDDDEDDTFAIESSESHSDEDSRHAPGSSGKQTGSTAGPVTASTWSTSSAGQTELGSVQVSPSKNDANNAEAFVGQEMTAGAVPSSSSSAVEGAVGPELNFSMADFASLRKGSVIARSDMERLLRSSLCASFEVTKYRAPPKITATASGAATASSAPGFESSLASSGASMNFGGASASATRNSSSSGGALSWWQRTKKNIQETTKVATSVAQGLVQGDPLSFHEKRPRTLILCLNYMVLVSPLENNGHYVVHSCRRINAIRRLSFEEDRPNRVQVEYKDKAIINIYHIPKRQEFMNHLQTQLMALNIGMKSVA